MFQVVKLSRSPPTTGTSTKIVNRIRLGPISTAAARPSRRELRARNRDTGEPMFTSDRSGIRVPTVGPNLPDLARFSLEERGVVRTAGSGGSKPAVITSSSQHVEGRAN